MLLTDVPPSLVETLSSGRLVLFAGAGISKGSSLPSGRELALQMQTELFNHKFVSKRPSPEDLLQLSLVAQNYQTAFGRQKLNELLQRIFNREASRLMTPIEPLSNFSTALLLLTTTVSSKTLQSRSQKVQWSSCATCTCPAPLCQIEQSSISFTGTCQRPIGL
jgi:hypothetical protein